MGSSKARNRARLRHRWCPPCRCIAWATALPLPWAPPTAATANPTATGMSSAGGATRSGRVRQPSTSPAGCCPRSRGLAHPAVLGLAGGAHTWHVGNVMLHAVPPPTPGLWLPAARAGVHLPVDTACLLPVPLQRRAVQGCAPHVIPWAACPCWAPSPPSSGAAAQPPFRSLRRSARLPGSCLQPMQQRQPLQAEGQ